MTERGYLTLAVGSRRYLEMAVDMALSLREHTRLPVALAADEMLGAVARGSYRGVFDVINVVDDRFRVGRALKYGTAAASPFHETIFIDADSIVLGKLDHLFEALGDADLAMVGEILTRAMPQRHHGFITSDLMQRFGLDRYLKTNSGLFCFRTPGALDVMEECLRCYLGEARPSLRWSILRGRWLGDEIAFGIVGGRRRLATLPAPAPMYWPSEIAQIDLASPAKPLLHFIWPVPDAALDELLLATAERRRRAGIPGDAERHWRQEQRALKRMALRLRLVAQAPQVARTRGRARLRTSSAP